MGPLEIILIVLIVVLLFGARKLPELARGMGKSIKEFKKSVKEEDEEENTEEDKKQIGK
jgi:sec-independent protein translocase protein TatA